LRGFSSRLHKKILNEFVFYKIASFNQQTQL
jgi:hypothetical protein